MYTVSNDDLDDDRKDSDDSDDSDEDEYGCWGEFLAACLFKLCLVKMMHFPMSLLALIFGEMFEKFGFPPCI